MLVNMKDVLARAVKEQYAIGLFNILNLEWTKTILEVHQNNRAPVILGVSEGAVKYMGGLNTVYNLVVGLLNDLKITIPVALMLDHGSYSMCLKAIEAGFTSVMFDGSRYPIEENIKLTSRIVKQAQDKNVTVEGEVGTIACEKSDKMCFAKNASPNECISLSETGIDMLAIGVNNFHGVYPDNWQGLSFETISNIKKETGNLPLVLHGGSGIPSDQIKKAIKYGIAKVNVSSELQVAFSKEIKKYFHCNRDMEESGNDPRKILDFGMTSVRNQILNKLKIIGAINKS